MAKLDPIQKHTTLPPPRPKKIDCVFFFSPSLECLYLSDNHQDFSLRNLKSNYIIEAALLQHPSLKEIGLDLGGIQDLQMFGVDEEKKVEFHGKLAKIFSGKNVLFLHFIFS